MAIPAENILNVAADEEVPGHTLVMYIGETGRKQWQCSCTAEQEMEDHEEDTDGELDSDA